MQSSSTETHACVYTHLMKPTNDTLGHGKASCRELADSGCLSESSSVIVGFMLFDHILSKWTTSAGSGRIYMWKNLCYQQLNFTTIQWYSVFLQSFSCQVGCGCLGCLHIFTLHTLFQQNPLHVTLCLKEVPANLFAPLLFSLFFSHFDRTNQWMPVQYISPMKQSILTWKIWFESCGSSTVRARAENCLCETPQTAVANQKVSMVSQASKHV